MVSTTERWIYRDRDRLDREIEREIDKYIERQTGRQTDECIDSLALSTEGVRVQQHLNSSEHTSEPHPGS